MSLDAYDLRPLPRLRLLDQATGGSLPLSRFSFTLLDLFLVFLMATLGILAAFSLLLSTPAHPIQAHLNPSISSALPVQRPVVNTPARAFDLTTPSLVAGKAVAAPSTGVTPVDGLGDVGFYDYFTDTINKHITLKVNVGDGNLVVETSDVSMRGTGIDLSLGGTYNSLQNHFAQHGTGWNFNFGSDVALQSNSNGSMTYFDPTGHAWTYASNGKGGWTDPAGLDADLAAGSNGTHTLKFYHTGEVYSFNTANILVKDTDKNNNSVTFNTDANNASQVDSITDTQGRTTTISYDANGHVSQITDPFQRSISYSYNSDGELTSSTDQNGNVTQFVYSNSRLVKITDPLSNTTEIAYNDNGLVGSLHDPLQDETNFTYYGSSASECNGVQPSGTNPTLNPCTVIHDANNHKTTYGYDTTFRVLKVRDANGNTTSRTYSADNNVQKYTDGLQDQSNFSFSADSSGHYNLNSVTDGNNHTTTFGYTDTNHPNYPTTLTDATGQQTTATYDGNGNLATSTNKGTGITTGAYSYNTNGTIATEKDGKNNTTSFSYDSKGNLTTVTFASPLKPQTLTYDGASRVTSLTDGNGHKTTYTYDNLDQVLKVTYADNTSVAYTYDGNGNISSITDHTGVTSYTYDADNRQVTKTLPGGTVITTSFDPVGNLTSLSTVGGTTSYSYTPVNLLASLTEPGGATTTFSYDANYHRTKTSYPNGVSLNTSYDNDGQILSIVGQFGTGSTAKTLTSYSYSYTKNNLRSQVVDQTGSTTTYGYDTLSRLTSANLYNGAGTHTNAFSYAYDAAGNWTSFTQGVTSPSTITYSYNAANELTSSSKVSSYSYDSNGNLTGSSATPSITYNAANQTTAIGSTTFGYSGPDQNQRVQVNNTNYVYSGLGCDCESNSAGTTYYTHDNSGQLIDERTPTGTYYYLFDGLGSVVGLTDSTGALVGNETYHYDPYGVLLSQPVSTVLQQNAWRYASGYDDVSTGLYKFGIRYYDATTGRWTQRDPVGGSLQETTKANPYVYADDDPVNETDGSRKGLGSDLYYAGAWLVGYLTFDTVAGAALDVFFGAALALLAGSPIGAIIAAFVLVEAFLQCLQSLYSSLIT